MFYRPPSKRPTTRDGLEDPDGHGKVYRRHVRKRVRRMKGYARFVSVNDGPLLAAQLARAIEARFGTA